MACKLCGHKDRAKVEEEAKAASSLDALLDVCERHDVTRDALKKHLAKCPPIAKAARDRRRAKAAAEDAPPDSGPREAQEERQAPSSPPRELGGAREELRALAASLRQTAESPQLSAREKATLATSAARLIGQLERLRADVPIHEHADFEGLVMDLVAAVVSELGPGAPDGLEGRIAERFEELQAERAFAGTSLRRAA